MQDWRDAAKLCSMLASKSAAKCPTQDNLGVRNAGKKTYLLPKMEGNRMRGDTAGQAACSQQGTATTYPWVASYPPGLVWDQQFTPRPVYPLLDEATSGHPDRPCTNFLGKVTTYAEIGSLVNRMAAGLQRHGIGKGSKVGLLLPNSPTFIICYFAVLKLGGTVVNYNPLYTVEELTHQIKDSETELIITLDLAVLFEKVEQLLQSGVLPRAVVCSFPSLLPATKSILFRMFKGRQLANPAKSPVAHRLLFEADLIANDGQFTPATIDVENDIAVLQYTGGTTGTPKGAMLTHANIYINVLQSAAFAPSLETAQHRVLAILPFFHVFALTVVLNFGIAKAAELIIMPRFVLDEAIQLIAATRPTVMPGVPTLFNALMNHPKFKNLDFSSLKYCLSGGAALPVEVKERFEAVTGCKLVEGYGLSETSPVVTSNPLEGLNKPGSIGLPVPGTIISLRDLSDPTREVAPGEHGEVCIKGPQVMKGYWRKPEETAASFVDGFFRTGDVGMMDEDGYFYIVDRIKDLIICSGFNVYPRRIEEALYQHPAVEEASVVGIEDPCRGEAPKAFIKLKRGKTASKAEIMAHLEKKLSRIELPAEIEFRDELPKTLIGKPSKRALKTTQTPEPQV